MPTTVRLRDEDKAALDALQARYTLATGERISLSDLLGLIVGLAEEHEDEIILEDRAPELSDEEIAAYLDASTDWGVETSEEMIDEVLYGGEDPA